MFTTGATTDAVTNWIATAAGDNAVQNMNDVLGYLGGLVPYSYIANGSGTNVTSANPVSLSAPLTAGADVFTAANNVFLIDATTVASAQTILNDKAFTGSISLTGDGIIVAFIDENADLNIGIARLTISGGKNIDASTIDVQGIFAGTFSNADVNAANFGFI